MSTFISFTAAQEKQDNHPVRDAEIPIEHTLSIPMPTLRFKSPAYAGFSSPTTVTPRDPIVQGAPRHWWLLDAVSGRLILFAACRIYPFAETAFAEFTYPEVTQAADEMEADWERVLQRMEELAPAFFSGQEADAKSRKALADGLSNNFPEPLLAQYQALAPDFFAWLTQ